MASPAAAAQVSRALAKAGIPKARELRKGIESTGYVVEPRPTHVQVEYVSFTDDDEQRKEGLSRCQRALEGKYEVKASRGTIAVPGELRDGPVLEVRSDRWEVTIEQRIQAAEEEIRSHGFALHYVEFCEDAETPGILGCYRGITSHDRKKVKIRTSDVTRSEIADVLEHEAHHVRDPLWDCGNRGVVGGESGAARRRREAGLEEEVS